MNLLARLFGTFPQGDQLRLEESATEVHLSAALLESLQMSHRDLATLLRTALKVQHTGEKTHVWPRDVYDDSVVYEVYDGDAETLYQRSYTITDGAVTLGEPMKVIAVTQYVRADQSQVTVPAVPVTQVSAPAEESGDIITGDLVPLTEKAVGVDNTIKLKIIQAGHGSSGYYPADMLKRDGPRVFKAGTHMHLDHPSVSEEAERPERSITTLAGTLTSDAKWDDNGAAGPGLYAEAKVRSDLAPLIEELAPSIGVSIRAMGKARQGQVAGKPARIIDAIGEAKSVDFVTIPGAGGSILQLVESARNRRANAPTEDDDVSKEELDEANRKIAALEAKIDAQEKRDAEAQLLREAHGVVTETLATIALPKVTRDRLTGQLAANPPLKEGALDRDALIATVKEAATAELAYLASVTGGNPVRSMGGPTSTDPVTPTLEESGKRIDAALAAL